MSFLAIFTNWEPLDFEWMKKASQDQIVFFGCLICFGLALAFGA